MYYCKIGSSHQPNEMLPEPGRVGLWGFDTNIKYEVIWGNLVLGILLCETIVAPVYFFGFSLFEPVGEK